jgi:hypothetical protein
VREGNENILPGKRKNGADFSAVYILVSDPVGLVCSKPGLLQVGKLGRG